MKRRPRIYYSEGQKAMMWDRWQRGESLHDIAHLFDRGHSSIQRILSESGGIRPVERVRSSVALSISEREAISRGLVADHLMRSIAASLRRAPSSVSREIRRNGGCQGYRASNADQADVRRRSWCTCTCCATPAPRTVGARFGQAFKPSQRAPACRNQPCRTLYGTCGVGRFWIRMSSQPLAIQLEP